MKASSRRTTGGGGHLGWGLSWWRAEGLPDRVLSYFRNSHAGAGLCGYRLSAGHCGQSAVLLKCWLAQMENQGRPRQCAQSSSPFVTHRNRLLAVYTLQNMHALFCKDRSNQIPPHKRELLRSTPLVSKKIQRVEILLKQTLGTGSDRQC